MKISTTHDPVFHQGSSQSQGHLAPRRAGLRLRAGRGRPPRRRTPRREGRRRPPLQPRQPRRPPPLGTGRRPALSGARRSAIPPDPKERALRVPDDRHRRRRVHRLAPGRPPAGRRRRGRRRRQLRPVLRPEPASGRTWPTPRRNPRFRLVEVDIRDAEAVPPRRSRARPDAIVHLAARAGVRPSIEQPGLYAEVNVSARRTCSRPPGGSSPGRGSSTPPAPASTATAPTPRSARTTPSTARSAPTPPPRRPASCWPTPSTTSTACPSPACGSSPPTARATAPTWPSPSSPA